ncbi:MAG: HTH domain-containing protein [Planctomycetota bacterium]
MGTKSASKTNRNAKAASKATTTKATTKNATVAKPAAKESKPAEKKMSQIEAAVAVLAKAKQPMNCKSMVDAMQVEGLWASPGGATPDATLYASILREINTKATDARFKKIDRGLFALNANK